MTTRLGDFVGIGALIPAAYARSGDSVLGPALLLASPALTALILSTVCGGWLSRQEPRRGLVRMQILGAAALMLPLLSDSLGIVLLAAMVFGIVRTGHSSLQATYVTSFPEAITGRFYGTAGTVSATLELVGYLAGASLALAVGLGPALMIDVSTFLIAAVLLSRLPALLERQSRRGTPGLVGWATVRRTKALRPYLIGLLGFGALANMPETLTAASMTAHPAILPVGLALISAGTAIGAMIAGRTAKPDSQQPFTQLLFLGVGSLIALFVPWGVLPGNFVMGLGLGWVAAAQGAVIRLVPPQRVAPLVATLTAFLLVMEGLGTLAIGAAAALLGVGAAYVIAAVSITFVAVGATSLWRHSGPVAVVHGMFTAQTPAPSDSAVSAGAA